MAAEDTIVDLYLNVRQLHVIVQALHAILEVKNTTVRKTGPGVIKKFMLNSADILIAHKY